jgi:hypothetical protein
VWIPIALYLLALVARTVMGVLYPDPAYPDSYYYVEVARSLASGNGFEVPFIWIFVEVGGTIPPDPVIPVPSNAHWMPLSSILAAPVMAVFGFGDAAQLASYVLIGSLAAPLTWAIARDVGARPWVCLGAGLIVAIPGLLTPFMSQPDNFGIYQPLVAAALWLGARGLRGSGRSFMAAGFLAGLATLARTDGVLVLAGLGLVWLGDRWLAWRARGAPVPRPPRISFGAAVGCVALFLVVMGPWWLRQLAVFGSISPSTATGKVLLIRDFGEWDSITTPATWEHFLGQGLGPLLQSRFLGLAQAIWIYVVLGCSVILAPFALIGGWRRRRDPDFAPFYAYAGLLFLANFVLFAVHVPGGTFIHSACALVPFTSILALEGVEIGVRAVAARRRSWDAETATRVFGSSVVGVVLVAGILGALAIHPDWAVERGIRQRVDVALDDAGVGLDERLMSIDAGGYHYWTGREGVVIVNDPLETVHEVAAAYDIRWLILERQSSVPPVAPILDGDERPDWIGPPIYTEGGEAGSRAVDVGVYPICLDAADPRCP